MKLKNRLKIYRNMLKTVNKLINLGEINDEDASVYVISKKNILESYYEKAKNREEKQ